LRRLVLVQRFQRNAMAANNEKAITPSRLAVVTSMRDIVTVDEAQNMYTRIASTTAKNVQTK
jgi:hypothetical protein